jgi:hypothetical protein
LNDRSRRKTKKNRLAAVALTQTLATRTALCLAACGGDGGDGGGGASAATAAAEESEAFVADMEAGVKIVNDAVAEEPATTKIMLASDVEQPTQKYGMWVMPYYPSEAVEKFTMTIEIDNGDFVVECVSAATGKTWQMDQDGNMTEASAG